MPQKIHITFKTRSTLVNIFKKEMDELGFDISGLKNEKDTLHAYCSYVSRLVETRPRKIHKSDTFVCPEDVKNGLAWLESKIEIGESVNAHLNGATKKNKLDGLLYDWGIQHLHLGEKLVAPGYVERTGNVLIGNMSFVGPRPDVPGYADKLEGDDRDVLRLRPGITGPATLKYRLEDELLAEVRCLMVTQKSQRSQINWLTQEQIDGMTDQELAVWYNDNVIYPDKVRLNCYYYRHYSFLKDLQMIICTVLGRKMEYAGETI